MTAQTKTKAKSRETQEKAEPPTREELEVRLRDADDRVADALREAGDAGLEGREAPAAVARLQKAQEDAAIVRATLEAMDRRRAAEDAEAEQREVERRRARMYRLTAKWLRLREPVLRLRQELEEPERELSAFQEGGDAGMLRRYQNEFLGTPGVEFPSGVLSDGGDDPGTLQAEAEHFDRLAEEAEKAAKATPQKGIVKMPPGTPSNPERGAEK